MLVQLINTDPKYFWATSFFETCLLRAVWYPTTIGTISWLSKQIIQEALEQYFGQPAGLAAHAPRLRRPGRLVSTVGRARRSRAPGELQPERHRARHPRREEWYNAGKASNSGPNSEHAGFCAWGREHEAAAMRNMLETHAPHGCALLLTDTYDHENAVKNIVGSELKEQIQNFPGLVGSAPTRATSYRSPPIRPSG